VKCSIANPPFYIVENNINTGLFKIISPFTDLSEDTKKSIYIVFEEGLWGT
jgi:hypothetical protein